MNNANPADFSYPVFDRQLNNLLRMSQVLLEGWDDYSTTELNHDLRSLCTKSARICYLADIDRTLQQEAFNRQRLEPNYFFLEQFNDLVRGKLVPHLKATISQIREGKPFQGHTSPLSALFNYKNRTDSLRIQETVWHATYTDCTAFLDRDTV